MVKKAGGATVPFWTGLYIDSGNKLTGSYEKDFASFSIFGTLPPDDYALPTMKSIYWVEDFGAQNAARYIYLHNGFYVAAAKDFQHNPPVNCMCQEPGKWI